MQIIMRIGDKETSTIITEKSRAKFTDETWGKMIRLMENAINDE